MFHLSLPTLDGIPAGELLRLREDERPSFEAFRSALRRAMKERLAPGRPPQEVAKEIEGDIIRPAVADIERRLKAAERASPGTPPNEQLQLAKDRY